MRKGYKFVFLTTLLCGSLFSAGCVTKNKPMYSNLHVIKDAGNSGGFLHYVDFDDYREDDNLECLYADLLTSGAGRGGCSAVRCGDFFGRNFDYYYADYPMFVVHVKGNDHRFESIGVGRHHGISREDILNIEKSGKYNKHIEYIPNLTSDGINENGVVFSLNVVDLEAFRRPSGTHPDKKDLNLHYAGRYILDNAKSAKHAIELLDERNVYISDLDVMNFHLMIADPNETYIVEFVNHQMVAEKKTGDAQIMTNFYNNLSRDPSGLAELNEHAMGVERYRWLRGTKTDVDYYYNPETDSPFYGQKYPEECKDYFTNRGESKEEPTKWTETSLNSMGGMMKALENVKFSRGYFTLKNDSKDEYYSIWPSEDCPQSILNNNDSYTRWQKNYFKYYHAEYAAVIDNKRRDLCFEWEIWITRHSCVYDIKNKTMRIACEEDFEHTTDFSLSGEVIK